MRACVVEDLHHEEVSRCASSITYLWDICLISSKNNGEFQQSLGLDFAGNIITFSPTKEFGRYPTISDSKTPNLTMRVSLFSLIDFRLSEIKNPNTVKLLNAYKSILEQNGYLLLNKNKFYNVDRYINMDDITKLVYNELFDLIQVHLVLYTLTNVIPPECNKANYICEKYGHFNIGAKHKDILVRAVGNINVYKKGPMLAFLNSITYKTLGALEPTLKKSTLLHDWLSVIPDDYLSVVLKNLNRSGVRNDKTHDFVANALLSKYINSDE